MLLDTRFFISFLSGSHKVFIDYAGVPIQGSPFTIKVFDASQVRVSNIHPGLVNRHCSFTCEYFSTFPGSLLCFIAVHIYVLNIDQPTIFIPVNSFYYQHNSRNDSKQNSCHNFTCSELIIEDN